MMRLQKFLAHAGVASRRAAEELITTGKVKVNGEVVTRLGTEIDEYADRVDYNGKFLKLPQKFIYLAMNKPVGYVCSSSSEQGKTVFDLIKRKERLYTVGRLDKDSSGLLIITNDGEFANELAHPRYEKEKEYFVVLDRDLKLNDKQDLERGIRLDDKKLLPSKITFGKNNSLKIIIKEGINRQVRRMFGRYGYDVRKLRRIRIGNLELGNLKEGQTRPIKKEDI